MDAITITGPDTRRSEAKSRAWAEGQIFDDGIFGGNLPPKLSS
jgi:hypothetical protein